MKPVCGRCYEEVDTVYSPDCTERPEMLRGQPIGMYHCPECGAMLIAGLSHPELCHRCLNHKHPGFDEMDIIPTYEKTVKGRIVAAAIKAIQDYKKGCVYTAEQAGIVTSVKQQVIEHLKRSLE